MQRIRIHAAWEKRHWRGQGHKPTWRRVPPLMQKLPRHASLCLAVSLRRVTNKQVKKRGLLNTGLTGGFGGP
ncbi:MAG: hypothetical protein WAX89_04030 [Alphaproteobacteria bacterium]